MSYCISNIQRFDQVQCIRSNSRSFPHDKIKKGDILKVADTFKDYFDGEYLCFFINGEKVIVIASMFKAINQERISKSI